MEDRSSGVLTLQLILFLQHFKDVFGGRDGQLAGVGVIMLLLPRCDDLGIRFLIEVRQTVARPFGGGGFQIVQDSAARLLEALNDFPKIGKGSQSERLPCILEQAASQKVDARLLHSEHPDRGEVVRPVGPLALLHARKVHFAEGIHPPIRLSFDDLALDFKALFGQQGGRQQLFPELIFIGAFPGEPTEVDRHHPDRTG